MATPGVGSGVGGRLGDARAGLENLIVQAVEPHQTGAAGGMNTVMRTIGGALGGHSRRRSSPTTCTAACRR